ncbi:succinyl-CoA synthetase subunit beta [Salmonella enterica subsp. enterica]|uniref:Succinyl-CoA synthetase subunit beta n=1 Tax=Salmonella enterica I TaxID=59201 RepID=A0A447MVX2_SALET|nr:succinyl-CoA synthetase subunit beta [Salmonella enterica subsp. enterica]
MNIRQNNFLPRYGLPAPVGYACTTPREAEEAASKIGAGPWVVKCQVHAGGRGKAGGVKVVKSKEEIRAFAEKLAGQTSGDLSNRR